MVERIYAKYFPEGGGAWIGLRSMHSRQLWSWTSGARFDFMNWEPDQEFDNSPERDALCGWTNPDGKWLVDVCTTKMPHILCTKPTAVQPASDARRKDLTYSGAPSTMCDGALANGKCWIVLNAHIGYEAAQLACYQWGGSLASLASQAEIELVTSLVAERDAWIGLRQQCTASGCAWEWEDTATELKHVQWMDGDPAEASTGTERCAYISAHGLGLASKACDSVVTKSVCSKKYEVPSMRCQTCESLLTNLNAKEQSVTVVSSGCECGCCFYFHQGTTTLRRVGECSSMCSTLNLQAQNITDLDDDVFEGLKHVRVLTLTRSSITVIRDGVFKDMSSLSVLDLGNNAISQLGPRAFEGLPVLVELYLDRNDFSHIAGASLEPLQNSLLLLSLASNRIASIEHGAFSNLSSLVVLSLSGNLIEEFESIQSPNLVALYMDSNLIANLPSTAFVGSPSVRHLHLNNNTLSHIDRRAFYPVPGLHSQRASGHCVRHSEPPCLPQHGNAPRKPTEVQSGAARHGD